MRMKSAINSNVVGITVDYQGYQGYFAVAVSNWVKGFEAMDRAYHHLKVGDMENILLGPVNEPKDDLLSPVLELTNAEGDTIRANPHIIGDYIVGMKLLTENEIRIIEDSQPTNFFERLKQAFA